jgi:ribose transport system substrate-binding protein
MDRRLFMRRTLAAAGAGLVTPALLSACTDEGGAAAQGGEATEAAATRREQYVSDGRIDLQGLPVVAMYTSLNNDYYSSWDLGARRAVEALGGEYRALTNEGDPSRQISQFEQQLQAGAKVFFITAPDPANIPALAALAEGAEDVVLVNTHEMPEWATPFEYGDSYVTYFTLNNIEAGYETAKALFEQMGGEGGLVHLSGHPGATPDWQRTLGLQRALEETPGIELLGSQPGEWNRDDARQVMAGFITAQGANINGVFCQNDDVGIGAMNALEEAGIEGVPVTGIDGNQETMGLILEGRYFGAYTQFPFWQAGYSCVRAVDAYLGWVPRAPERNMFTAGAFITADSAQQYLDRFFEGPDPFDWQLMSHVLHPDDWDPQNRVWPMDLEEMWSGVDKPEGWEMPEPLAQSIASGEFDEVAQEYEEHNRIPIFEG